MRLAPEPADGQPQLPAQRVEVAAATVLEFDPLEQVPHPLGRVQLPGVPGQAFELQSRGRAGGFVYEDEGAPLRPREPA